MESRDLNQGLKRFDRVKNGGRDHFFSVTTLLRYTDGADAVMGVSYLELLELLITRGSNVENDTEQLWRRIVFNKYLMFQTTRSYEHLSFVRSIN